VFVGVILTIPAAPLGLLKSTFAFLAVVIILITRLTRAEVRGRRSRRATPSMHVVRRRPVANAPVAIEMCRTR
jgi:hypothetical protein